MKSEMELMASAYLAEAKARLTETTSRKLRNVLEETGLINIPVEVKAMRLENAQRHQEGKGRAAGWWTLGKRIIGVLLKDGGELMKG
jgi:hypothetical protein